MNTQLMVRPGDRFHVGSNTKAITAFIAALLVKEGKISWNTTIFSLYPAWKEKSRRVYDDVTLEQLLTFRGKLPGYTYTFEKPTDKDFSGNDAQQRLQLAQYFLAQPPMKEQQQGLTPSNVDYILAGLMLEKASGKPYKQLVKELGERLDIDFRFDYPNLSDSTQPWGHDGQLQPLPPAVQYKMNWLLSAGNINVNMTGYCRFVQLQLKGLKGKTAILPRQTFEQLHFGWPVFSFGWFNHVDSTTHHHISSNEGNAGAFITQVYVVKEADRAYVIFTNAATAEAAEGIAVLRKELMRRYGK